MKLTKLNFPYCNLADLGKKFDIEIPEQDTPEFFNLNTAVMEVLSHDSEIRSGNKFDWNSPLGSENTEAQKVEAFQTCIKIMRESGISSDDDILKTASKMESVLIADTTIPANAKPEEIEETLKKTIEAVVASLEGHKPGVFIRKTGKSEAIKELGELRKLANSEAIDLGELKKSLGIMEKFQDESKKYEDYQLNLSILKRLASSIEEHNSSKETSVTTPLATKLNKGPEIFKGTSKAKPVIKKVTFAEEYSSISAANRLEKLNAEESGQTRGATKSSLGELKKSGKYKIPRELTYAALKFSAENRSKASAGPEILDGEEELQLKLAIELSSKEAAMSPNATLLKGWIGEISSRKPLNRNAQNAQPATEEDEGLAKAIKESLEYQARASKEQPYDLDQIKSALEVYKKRAEGAHLISVQFSDEQITSEKLLKESLGDYESPSEGIFVGQLKSIKFEGFLKDKEKEIFLCPYLDGTTAGQDSHWKLLQFKKGKGERGQDVIKMTTIDPLGVEHSTKEWPSLIEAMKTAANECGCKFGFFTENGQKIAVQTRGNNTECGPAICYIMDQIARGVDINAIATPNLENLRKEQRQVTAPSHVDRVAAAKNSGAKPTRGIVL